MQRPQNNLSNGRREAPNGFRPVAPEEGFSMMALQEEIVYPGRHGVIGARRRKLLRIDRHAAAPGTQAVSHELPLPEPEIPRQLPQPVAPPRTPAYKKVFEGPGVTVTVLFSCFRNEIAPQLRHPERLRDEHQMECYVQILDINQAVPAAQIAAAELGDAALAPLLHPLIQSRAQLLGLPQFFRPCRHPYETRAAGRQLYPGQRIYYLRPLFDPTAIEPPDRASRQQAPEPQPTPVRRQPDAKCEVPPAYYNPVQFRFSREEVLYDMRAALGTLSSRSGWLVRCLFVHPMRLLKAMLTVLSNGSRIRKWRTLLANKAADEQLWAVSPPHGFTYDWRVLRWAEEALARAGYDPARMVVEWEVYWRRRGFV